MSEEKQNVIGQVESGCRTQTALSPKPCAHCPTQGAASSAISPEALAQAYEARLAGRSSAPAARNALRRHLLPALAALGISDVRALTPALCRQAVAVEVPARAAAAGTPLAPKTIWNVWAVLRAALAWQIEQGRLDDPNPARGMRHGYHVEQVDHAWRDGAWLELPAAQALILSPEIAAVRRHFYAAAIMLGTRHSELAALRVRDFDRRMTPLPGIVIEKRWDSSARVLRRGTKTGRPRIVPVHQLLARMFVRWLEPGGGFEQAFGRRARPDDLLVPCLPPGRPAARPTALEPRPWARQHALRQLHRDLDLLGIHRVRLHDLRRTWRTLAKAAGVQRETRDLCTHAPPSDTRSLYESAVWGPICEEISRIPFDSPLQLPLRLAG